MTRVRHLCAFGAIALSVMSFAVRGAAQSTPAAAVRAFYSAYAQKPFTGLPTGDAWRRIVPSLSASLKPLIVAAQAAQAKCIKAHPGDKPPWIEGDMFTSNFEGFTRFTVVDSGVTSGARATVTVEFAYAKGGKPFVWRDQVIVAKEGERWLVDDVHYRKAEGFGNGFGEGLRKALAPGGGC
jgi:hypothetical protein